jgi:transcriptional regulator with XRE-family HTH domain
VPEPGRPTIRHRRLGVELRRLRERAGLNGEDVADRLGWSPSKVSRIENARQSARLVDVRKLLDVYEVDTERRERLVQLTRDVAHRGWWADFSAGLDDDYAAYIDMEAEAEGLWSWETDVIPGLLQTDAYMRAVIEPWQDIIKIRSSVIDDRIAARLQRQKKLAEQLEMSIVLDESVLLRRYGAGASVMAGQLDRLVELVDQRPNLTLRVLPLNGPHPIGSGSFTVLWFPNVRGVRVPDVVYVEQLSGGSYIEEEADTYRYRLTFEQLTTIALSPDESLDLISRTARSAWH